MDDFPHPGRDHKVHGGFEWLRTQRAIWRPATTDRPLGPDWIFGADHILEKCWSSGARATI
jgi:hypothetical protein